MQRTCWLWHAVPLFNTLHLRAPLFQYSNQVQVAVIIDVTFDQEQVLLDKEKDNPRHHYVARSAHRSLQVHFRHGSWRGVKRFVFCCGRFAFMSVDKDNLEEPLHVYYRALGSKRVSEYPILIQNVLVTTQCHKYRLCRPSCPPCVHSPAASGWRTFSFSQGDNDRFWRTEWTPQTVQLIRCSHPCSHSPSIPPARPFQIYENGPLWQPPPCDKRVEESGHHVVKKQFS